MFNKISNFMLYPRRWQVKSEGFTLYPRRWQVKSEGFTLYPRREQVKSEGFTLIEMVVVMAIVLLLLSFASINLFNLPISASIDATVNTVVEDMKSQQIKAMVGDTEGRETPDTYGIYFTPTSYTLFHGASYTATDPSNFVSSLPTGYNMTTTLPSSYLVFSQGSGEIVGFSSTQNSITIKNNSTGNQKVIILNKYGTIVDIH